MNYKFLFHTSSILIVLIANCGAAALSAAPLFNVQLVAGRCQMDGEISKVDRDAGVEAATSFVQAMLGPKPDTAYTKLTQGAQAVVPPKTFGTILDAIKSSGPYDKLHLEHVYSLSVVGSDPLPPSLCGEVSSPEKWVAVAARAVPKQMHVVLSAKTRNNDWAFTLWLHPDGGQWRVESFYVSMESMAGHFPVELIAKAREQTKRGHLFNAAALYVGVQGLINRGPNFQLGLQQEFQEDTSQFVPPPELKGKPPFIWHLNGYDFHVDQVSIMGVAGQLVLMIVYDDPSWDNKNEVEANQRNRTLIDSFIKTHPEYSEVFGSVLARLWRADKTGGFGTVYEAGKGYD